MPKTASVSLENIETDFSTELIEIELPGGTRGLQGPQGIQGETGKTPQFHVGSVTDTDEAEVSITGTKNDPVLNMGLPRGKSGVWVGETPPDNEQYKVWINPESTPSTVPKKTSELTNDSGFIDKSVNDLTNYELKTSTGNNLDADLNGTTLTVVLKNSAGTVISTDTVSFAELIASLGQRVNNYSTSSTDGYSCSYINNAVLDNYSSNEQIIGTTDDDKPIYRRKVIIENVTSNTLNTVTNGLEAEHIMKYYGYAIAPDSQSEYILPYYDYASGLVFQKTQDGELAYKNNMYTLNNGTICVWIEYTKLPENNEEESD